VASAFAELNDHAPAAEPSPPVEDGPPLEAPAGSYAPGAAGYDHGGYDHILAEAPSPAAQAEMLDTAALLRELASLNGDAPAPQQATSPRPVAAPPPAAPAAKKRRRFGL
jgi:hypothetical protein